MKFRFIATNPGAYQELELVIKINGFKFGIYQRLKSFYVLGVAAPATRQILVKLG